MNYSCVFFDLDGTLVNTIGDIAAAMNHALGKFHFPELPVDDYIPIVGRGIKSLALHAMPISERNESLAAIIAGEAEGYYREHAVVHSKVYPGILEMLGVLKRKKVKLAIISNKPDSITRLVAATLFPLGTFDAVSGETPEMPRKPDPSLAWEMLSHIDMTPRRTVFVGDSEVDMQTAINIGALPIGVSWGYGSVDAIIHSGSARIVNHPQEIVNIVE
jgi:phosphoglycolate phosphatase